MTINILTQREARGFKPKIFDNPQQFGKETWTQLSPLEKNQQRQEALIQWKPE